MSLIHYAPVETRLPMTPRQEQILHYVSAFKGDFGFPPTRSEIALRFGFKSANAAEEHLQALARKGYLRITRGVSRGLAVV